jgi:hypothetical protein
MNKKTDTALADYLRAIKSGTDSEFEQMSLFVPKRSAKKFRAMANDSNMSENELFEKMVDSFVYGSFLKK